MGTISDIWDDPYLPRIEKVRQGFQAVFAPDQYKAEHQHSSFEWDAVASGWAKSLWNAGADTINTANMIGYATSPVSMLTGVEPIFLPRAELYSAELRGSGGMQALSWVGGFSAMVRGKGLTAPDKPRTVNDFIDFNQGRPSDPGIPELVNAIETKFPGSVKQLEINIFKPNNGTDGLTGERFTDLDILTDKAVIQVKIGKGRGIAEQLRVSEEITGLKAIGFDANKLVNNPGRDGFRPGTIKDAQDKGFTITNDVEELLKILEEL
jgi:hypothetical protein